MEDLFDVPSGSPQTAPLDTATIATLAEPLRYQSPGAQLPVRRNGFAAQLAGVACLMLAVVCTAALLALLVVAATSTESDNTAGPMPLSWVARLIGFMLVLGLVNATWLSAAAGYNLLLRRE